MSPRAARAGAVLALLAAACAGPAPAAPGDAIAARFAQFEQPVGAARGEHWLIAGTTGAPAVAAGAEILRAGGSAMDAALATALGQVVLSAQSWVSGAGILALVVHDPATGEVHALSAAFAVPLGEDDPASIPATPDAGATGRMVLVPGFLPGLAAAHERFGRLPFADVVSPAIDFAERGFPLPLELAAMMARADADVARSQALRRMLRRPDGTAFAAGETFRQPELAATLRRLADEGPELVTAGSWARHLTDAVRAAGGRLAPIDLAGYEPVWSEPRRTTFRGLQVCAAGPPGFGGVSAIEALNVLEAARLQDLPDAAERLFWEIQVGHLQATSFLDLPTRALIFREDPDDARRCSPEWAQALWRRLRDGNLPLARPLARGAHSDAIVAADRHGQVVALVHSSNTDAPWQTGIVVDGVVVPGPASSQQDALARAGAGARLPDPMNPLLVLRDGRPVLASASIGAGLHPRTLQCVTDVLDGLDPAAAQARPAPLLSAWDDAGHTTARVVAGDYPPALLDALRALGQPVEELDAQAARAGLGYWVGLTVDPRTGRLAGACPARLNGAACAE